MATTQVSSVKSWPDSRSFTRALALAFSEWILLFMLFLHGIFSYLITKFADYSELQSPCVLCSRLDHILGKKPFKHYWDLICSKHKSEISSLVYCHAHDKLVDVHGMCETCLFSFATINKSNAETYRLLVGKLGENSCFGLNSDSSHSSLSPSIRYCTCCNQPWLPRAYTQVAEPEVPFNVPSVGLLRIEKQAVQARNIIKKKVGFYHLPHVGYSELKIHSDTESEAVFSDDEEGAGLSKGDQNTFQTVDLEPRVITLPYDMATDKLIDSVLSSEPLVSDSVTYAGTDKIGHGLKELNLQEIHRTMIDSVPQLISLDDFPEKDLISFSDVPLRSHAKEIPAKLVEEREQIFPHYISLTDFMEQPVDVSSQLDIHETPMSRLMETEFITFDDDVPSTMDAGRIPADVLDGIELIPLNDIHATAGARENGNVVSSFNDVSQSLSTNKISLEVSNESEKIAGNGTNEISLEASKESEEKAGNGTNEISLEVLKESEKKPDNDICAASEGIISSSESMDRVSEVPTINGTVEVKETNTAENNKLHLVRDENSTTQPAPKANPSSVLYVSEMPPESAPELNSSSFMSMPIATETNPSRDDSLTERNESLDLLDAYKIAVSNGVQKQSSGVQTEQFTGKDSCRISEDLKSLLTQISASQGIELLSPRDISPKISVSSEDMKNLDDMQLLLQKRMLERNESNLSLDGVAVNEIEGECEMDRLKRQVDHDRKLLTGLYKELEEERNASTVAANQAMAMITRLQEDKASFQMEALQNLREMEEQAEYDMEAVQKLNELLSEREKVIQDLEAELEFYREKAEEHHETLKNPDESETAEKASEAESPHKRTIQNSSLGFDDERSYITDCLEKIEKKLQLCSNHADISNGLNHVNGDASHEKSKYVASSVEDEVSELHERLERLKGDLYFLENAINSLGHGSEGVQFVKEIASHLQILRKRHETAS
ncbi:PREDICTED: myosin-binding protein 1 [Tarenaya hassleriana]|uniref:myosin-binding protein 1 n=1 Tax=Tarenaya hassleriana TaxID=28532 RepID=UPI00053CA04F|nr:PREDICTED: myosin-binding protein 1 [Tarenaya hassleriana]